MSDPALHPAEVVIRNYFRAKDENRPHLLESVFSAEALLEIRNDTGTITFPAMTHGREAIADVLVRSFGATYENIYTFCLQRPQGPLHAFDCDWLVAMTEKVSRQVRVGCGRYAWEFETAAPQLARRLVITIAAMQTLPLAAAGLTFRWLERLSYPWSSIAEVIAFVPDELEVAQYFRRRGAR